MNDKLKGNLLLLLASIIWGLSFVAQRMGGEVIGAFAFNSIRFALGGISLIPLVIHFHNKNNESSLINSLKKTIPSGIIAGGILFVAASLQQIAIMYTSVVNTAFITGLYIILVPILGLFVKEKVNNITWLSSIVAVIGLYILSIQGNFSINIGDSLLLIGAVFWAIHILFIDKLVKQYDAMKISMIQFFSCSLLSGIASLFFEDTSMQMVQAATIPILYGGIMSVGIAYTLQVVGQKYAKPSHAAIILSLEVVFGAIGSAIILREILTARSYIGAALMLVGMLLSQVNIPEKANAVPLPDSHKV